MQVRYLGNCLKGGAQEWYVWNIKHHDRVVHKWTLESALIEMQKCFFHSLMHRHTSMMYQATQQGSVKWHCSGDPEQAEQTNLMYRPDDYMQRKRFLVALHNPFCREVLMQGHTTEFSQMADLILTALQVEDAMRYDMGAWQSEVHTTQSGCTSADIQMSQSHPTLVEKIPDPPEAAASGPGPSPLQSLYSLLHSIALPKTKKAKSWSVPLETLLKVCKLISVACNSVQHPPHNPSLSTIIQKLDEISVLIDPTLATIP